MPLYVLVARKEEFNFTNSLLISRGLPQRLILRLENKGSERPRSNLGAYQEIFS